MTVDIQVNFDIQKNELLTLSANKIPFAKTRTGFNMISKRIQTIANVQVCKSGYNKEDLFNGKSKSILIFGIPINPFSFSEFDQLKAYLAAGGNIVYLAGEGGEKSNFNYLLEEFGINVNSGIATTQLLDTVARMVYSKYYHPKEVLVNNGILNREINRAAKLKDKSTCSFVYPFGSSLNVQKPSIPILSTGTAAAPLSRPVIAIYENKQSKGKLIVVGSGSMFSDDYLDQEDNAKIFDVLFQWMTTDNITFNAIDADDPDISDYHFVPDTSKIAESPKACLLEADDLPKDFNLLFDTNLLDFNGSLIPDATRLFDEMQLKKEPLSLIHPPFETPLPNLELSVFPPVLVELPAPGLELFDLDQEFASEKARLAQLTNKCTDEDLDYYILECATILNILEGNEQKSAKDVLANVFRAVANWKMLNPDPNIR